jgi:hypothetical protein
MATNRQYRGPTGPRLVLGASAKLAAALVVGSLVTWALGWYWLMLQPNEVLHGSVWQPLTFCFIETSPTGVLFGAMILVTVGGTLQVWWGPAKLVRFLLAVTIASGVATLLLGLAFVQLRYTYFAGGGAMVSAAWCAYGWTLGRSQVSMYGVVVTGNQLAAIGILIAVLGAAYGSLAQLLPEGIAIALTYAYVRKR